MLSDLNCYIFHNFRKTELIIIASYFGVIKNEICCFEINCKNSAQFDQVFLVASKFLSAWNYEIFLFDFLSLNWFLRFRREYFTGVKQSLELRFSIL